MKRIWLTTMVLLGALAWTVAAAPLSGGLEGTIKFAPSTLTFGNFITNITSKLTIDYTLASWEFGSESTFNLEGWSLQGFSASGKLGGYALESTMQFDPKIVEGVLYTLASGTTYQTQSVTGVTSSGASAAWTKPIWNCATYNKAITYGSPAFSCWQAGAQISLFGMNFEGLFYLKGNDFEAETVSGKWVYGDPYYDWAHVVTQTGSYTASACLPRYGSGWKLTLSGTAADMLITSRTYFNLQEYSYNEMLILAYVKIYVADTFKLGGSYYLPKVGGETCQATFTREFITIEGVTLGCAKFDAGLNITCEGFNWLKILVTDIELSPFVGFDALVTFSITQTASQKTISLEPDILFGDTGCFTFHLAWDYTGTATDFSLQGLIINGISMSYTWNGLTFTSATSFNPVLGPSGYYLAADVNSPTTYGFFVPDKSFSKDKFNTSTGEGYYRQVCYPEEYYDIWEMFTIETSGDGCCGGDYEWKVNTYFGDRKSLIVDSFWFYYKDEDGNFYVYNTGSSNPAVITPPTVSGSAAPYCEDDDVSYGVAYYDADENTMFGWVKTDADVVVPISASIHLRFGIALNTYGWEKLELGFECTW